MLAEIQHKTLFAGSENAKPDDPDQGRILDRLVSRTDRTRRGSTRTIADRVRFVAVLLTLLLLGLGLVIAGAMYNLERANQRFAIVIERAMAASTLTAEIAQGRYLASRFAASGDPDQIEAAKSALAYARKELSEASAGGDADEESRQRIDWLFAQVEGFDNELIALERAVGASGTGTQAATLAEAIHLSGELLARDARKIERDLATRAVAQRESFERMKLVTALFAFATIVACVAIAWLAARNLRRKVARSISRIAEVTTRLARGERTMAIPETHRTDEIGELARALTVFRRAGEELDSLHETARREREELLRATAGRFENGVGTVVSYVASASSQLEETVTGMAAASSRAADDTDVVAREMIHVSDNVTAAAAATDQFASSIAEIGRQASRSAEAAHAAGDAGAEAMATIDELARVAEESGAIIAMIEAIAERTNLLALNASIEAARGGEAGRGFAVVATEVKELACQTRSATVEVGRRLEGMQGSTRTSIDALSRIGERVAQVETTATAIAQAVEEQSLSARELADNLDRAASGAAKIRSNIAEVRDLAQHNGEAASQLLDAAKGLRAEAEGLDTHAREFLASAQAA